MESLTSTLLSGAVYDIFKKGLSVSATTIKQYLKAWAVDEIVAPSISAELSKLKLNDEMSEKAIEKHISSSGTLMKILQEVRKSNQPQAITQFHSGSGDNVAGNKIVK